MKQALTERERVAAQLEAADKYADTAFGMEDRAAELRRGATSMDDSNDRDAMLRVAVSLERRADEVRRHRNQSH